MFKNTATIACIILFMTANDMQLCKLSFQGLMVDSGKLIYFTQNISKPLAYYWWKIGIVSDLKVAANFGNLIYFTQNFSKPLTYFWQKIRIESDFKAKSVVLQS